MNSIISKDGTRIAYNQSGKGPVVILVDGAFCSKDFGPMPKLVPLLSEQLTVISYDRRARGESGDTKPYSVTKEIEDLEALITAKGGAAYLFGISSGAILAMKAVAAGLNVKKLAVLEPPFVGNEDGKRPADFVQQLEQLISLGERAAAVNFYLRKVMGVPCFFTWILRLTPNWKKMKANALSLAYDAIICDDFNLPGKLVATLQIPVLAIDSTKSPKVLRNAVNQLAKALPIGLQVSLKGTIHDVPPKNLVPVLNDFFNN